MPAFNSVAEIITGDSIMPLGSTVITFESVMVLMSTEQLQSIRDHNNGQAAGAEFEIRMVCKNTKLAIHNKVYPVRIATFFRCSAKTFEVQLNFTKLSVMQRKEVKNTVVGLF
jgi:hypothetical protein